MPKQPVLNDIILALQDLRLGDAEALARTYLANMPADESALILLGLALQRQGRPLEAVEIYRRLVVLAPAAPYAWNNLATAQRESGASDEAKTAYRRALELDPNYYNAAMNLGFLHEELGEYDQALDAFLKAQSIDTNSPEARIHAAQMHFAFADNAAASTLLEPRNSWHDLPADLALDLAVLLVQFGKIDEARGRLQAVFDVDPANIRARAQMIALNERTNRLDDARKLLADLPALEDLNERADYEDVTSARVAMALRDNDIARARDLLDGLASKFASHKPISEDWYFLIAETCAKQGKPDQAMDALAKAHAIQLETARLVVPEMLVPGAQPLRTATIWIDEGDRHDWLEDPTAPSEQGSPIFIVGFPRSGTTMLEQMLDAHPTLRSMDERAFLQDLVERMSSFHLRYPYDLGKLTPAQCEELRQLYWSLCTEVAPRNSGQRLVDKNPLNMLRLPLINRLFPHAPIILALRHPCDVILSCYMQHFRSPAFAVLCSSLERLAKGYVAAMQFWLHHAKLLKPNVMQLRYEDLLDDFPKFVALIADFVGLEDTGVMMNFDRHARSKGFISTPSYDQVVEPPHKRAVGRWLAYRNYFDTALPILQPIMEHWGYER